jgi:ubiquinone/menaquinone biosynthesis C-methylase UbiE
LKTLSQIKAGHTVLEIGCGVGGTAIYLAEEAGCQVIGVDLSPGMVARSTERVQRRGLTNQIRFLVADAQDLPFDDGTFDAVIDESVTAFVVDKARAVAEYVRVTKPGGHVGLNEVTWLKTPSSELVRYVSFIMGGAEFLKPDQWRSLLVEANLQEVVTSIHEFNAREQFWEELHQLDWREYLTAWVRFVSQAFTNPAFWQFAQEVLSAPQEILRFVEYTGYGIYVGRKAINGSGETAA